MGPCGKIQKTRVEDGIWRLMGAPPGAKCPAGRSTHLCYQFESIAWGRCQAIPDSPDRSKPVGVLGWGTRFARRTARHAVEQVAAGYGPAIPDVIVQLEE